MGFSDFLTYWGIIQVVQSILKHFFRIPIKVIGVILQWKQRIFHSMSNLQKHCVLFTFEFLCLGTDIPSKEGYNHKSSHCFNCTSVVRSGRWPHMLHDTKSLALKSHRDRIWRKLFFFPFERGYFWFPGFTCTFRLIRPPLWRFSFEMKSGVRRHPFGRPMRITWTCGTEKESLSNRNRCIRYCGILSSFERGSSAFPFRSSFKLRPTAPAGTFTLTTSRLLPTVTRTLPPSRPLLRQTRHPQHPVVHSSVETFALSWIRSAISEKIAKETRTKHSAVGAFCFHQCRDIALTNSKL